MAFRRGIDGPESPAGAPVGGLSRVQDERRVRRSGVVARGTLACPLCDAPVALFRPVSPAAQLACPVCDHAAAVRDFLSLGEPTRPARVEVRVVVRSDAPVAARVPDS